MAGLVVALAGLYALRIADVIENWPFVIALDVAVAISGSWRGLAKPEAVEEAAGESEAEFADVPLEWRGIDRPWTEADSTRRSTARSASARWQLHGVT